MLVLCTLGCSSNVTISGKVEVKDPFEYNDPPAVKGKVIVFVERTSETLETDIKEDGTNPALRALFSAIVLT